MEGNNLWTNFQVLVMVEGGIEPRTSWMQDKSVNLWVIAYYSVNCSHNVANLKSFQSNATPQIRMFIIHYWHVSPITMKINVRLATSFM